MSLERAINIDDLRKAAKRALPKIIFDFIEGGVEAEQCLATNSGCAERLVPRYLGEVGPVDPSTRLLGRDYASPFGIGATGFNGLFRPGADLMLAEAAREAKIPFVLSTVSNASLEEVAKVAGEYGWFQLYGARDRNLSADLVRRADAAGYRTLVLTIDTPINSKRERNMRNGFSRPLRMRLPILFEAMTHPGWLWRYFTTGGVPRFENWAPYAGPNADNDAVAAFSTTQTPTRQTWKELETVRRLWPHKLVVKGVLHPDDAILAADHGVEGILVSNHGGRVFDRAPSTFDVFPFIKAAVGDRVELMLDSGITRGADIVAALALGARFTFVGRATLWGVSAYALPGARRAIDILRGEVNTTLAQMGCSAPSEVGPQHLFSSLAARPSVPPRISSVGA